MKLPTRPGQRPATTKALPHVQLNQWPLAEIARKLVDFGLALPDAGVQESRVASSATLALYLPQDFAQGPREAFIDDNEFCHLHPLPEGSVHLTLPDPLRMESIQSGWCESHPGVSGGLPKTLVMVYAPRDEAELQIVTHLVMESYRFARGRSAQSSTTGALGPRV